MALWVSRRRASPGSLSWGSREKFWENLPRRLPMGPHGCRHRWRAPRARAGASAEPWGKDLTGRFQNCQHCAGRRLRARRGIQQIDPGFFERPLVRFDLSQQRLVGPRRIATGGERFREPQGAIKVRPQGLENRLRRSCLLQPMKKFPQFGGPRLGRAGRDRTLPPLDIFQRREMAPLRGVKTHQSGHVFSRQPTSDGIGW